MATAEVFWRLFEITGSVTMYLLYKRHAMEYRP